MQKAVEIPDGVEVAIHDGNLTVKGPKGELSRPFGGVRMETKDRSAVITSYSDRRKPGALVGTWTAHLRNMITGVTRGWEARLKAVYSHFPVKFTIEGDRVTIQNFMGERRSRSARIMGDVKVDIRKDEIVITGIDKESVGQTAANIEIAAKVRGYDRRVFQDGCHLVQKCRPAEEKG
jgi:large subunit ribosomal protein L6